MKFRSPTKPHWQPRKKQVSKECMSLYILLLCMAVENNTNLKKKTKLEKNWCSGKFRYLEMDCKKHQSRIIVYTGSNDVLYWLYNRILNEKLEFTCEFLVFIYGFLWGVALLDSIFGCQFLCYPSPVELYYGTLDKGVRKERLSKAMYPNFGLFFEFSDMNKPDSRLFPSDPESKRLDI